MAELELGDVVGGYRILGILGGGALATVYHAVSTSGHHVALRVPHEELRRDHSLSDRLLEGARRTAAVKHPNVVQVIEASTDAGQPYIVMERVTGPSMAEVLMNRGALDADNAARLVIELAKGVAAAHRAGVTHGMLTPSNVVFGEGGGAAVPKLEGFGDPVLPELSSGYADLYLGRIEFLAPERLAGGGPSVSGDVYGLGSLLHAGVTGYPP